jgi:Tol biopolymer transport system component
LEKMKNSAIWPLVLTALLAQGCAKTTGENTSSVKAADWIFYANSACNISAIRPDGSGDHCVELSEPNQIYWQMQYVLPDGRQAVLRSQEQAKDPKAHFGDPNSKAFAKTHLWLYNFCDKTKKEINVPSFSGVIAVMPGSKRFVCAESRPNNTFCLFTTDFEGQNRSDICSGPGYAYCFAVSPDGRKVAYHVTLVPGRPGYEIYTVDLASRKKLLIVSDDQYIHFGPTWSPDGKWLLYQRCLYRNDPGHDRSDVCISSADGSQQRVLTTGQSHWFAAAYGTPEKHSSGSNMPVWSPDGRWIACTLLLPDSRTAWPWAPDRPDTDHFNRDYHPELAKGGTQICLIEPRTGKITPITHDEPPAWNFRLAWSPDGSRLAFVRTKVGEMAELWVMDADGNNQKFLTRGADTKGAEFPCWKRIPGAP